MSAEGGESKTRRSTIGRFLRPIVALAILALVLWSVPWSDALVWHDASGTAAVQLSGDIEGDWRATSVEFRVRDAQPAPDWPAALSAAVAEGRPVFVERRSGQGEGYEWKPGMPRVFGEIDVRGLLPALLLILFGITCVSARWWRLLALASCPTTFREAVRLTFLGLFFNLVMPGLTGGDLVKGVLVVRQNPTRRADALVTVVVDRVIGLAVLVGLASVVVLLSGERFAQIRPWVSSCFVLLLIGFWVLIHPRARRLFRFDALIERLPQKERLKSVDEALQVYARYPVEMVYAVALTLCNHLSIAGAIYFISRAYGAALSYVDEIAIASVANTISAVPISPAGWGVGEYAFRELYVLVGASPTIGVAVSITFRLLMMVMGLAGGLFLLLPSGRTVRSSLDTAAEAG